MAGRPGAGNIVDGNPKVSTNNWDGGVQVDSIGEAATILDEVAQRPGLDHEVQGRGTGTRRGAAFAEARLFGRFAHGIGHGGYIASRWPHR